MISIKSCNPFSRSECLAITEESCSFDSNIVFEFYCLLWLFAKLIKFLDYVLFLQVQTHFLEQYPYLIIADGEISDKELSELNERISSSESLIKQQLKIFSDDENKISLNQ